MRVIFLKLLYPVLALLSFKNPMIGLLNYVFISVIRPESLTWGMPRVKYVSLLAISCLFIASIIKKKFKFIILAKPFFFFFLLFYLLLLLSTYLSPFTYITMLHRQLTFSYMDQILIIFVFCACMYSIINHNEKYLTIYITFALSCFFFMGFWGIQQRLHGNMLIEGLFGNAIGDRCAITGIFVLVTPLAWFNFKYPLGTGRLKRYNKIIGGLSSFIFVLVIFFTDSRAGFLGFVFFLFVLTMSHKKKVRNFLIVGVVFLAIFPFLPQSYQERMASIVSSTTTEEEEIEDPSAASRMIMWKAAIKVFGKHLLLGVGNLNFPEAGYSVREYFAAKLPTRVFQYAFNEHMKLQCHNMFINIFAEGGVLTAIPFFIIMIIPIKKALKIRKIDDSNIPEIQHLKKLMLFQNAGLMGYLVTCFFANMRLVDFYYWQLTFLVILGETIEKKVLENKEKTAVKK